MDIYTFGLIDWSSGPELIGLATEYNEIIEFTQYMYYSNVDLGFYITNSKPLIIMA